MSDTPRQRLSEQETRSRLIDLAVTRLVDDGLTVGLDAVRMEKLIAEAGVSRASAYRCWPHRDDFLADVLAETVRQTSLIPEGAEEVRQLLTILDAHRARLADPQGRRDMFVESLRYSMDADVRRLLASPRWRFFLALSVTYQTLPDEGLRATVAQALADMERAFVERRADVYGNLQQLVGYRQRAPWQGREGLLVLSELAGTVMRGIVSRALADPSWLDQRHEAALFGSSVAAPWSQPEIAGVQVLLSHLEPDPDVEWTPEHLARVEAMFDEMARSLVQADADA